MGLTRIKNAGAGDATGLEFVVPSSEPVARGQDGAPCVLGGITVQLGPQPPVFDLSRAETSNCGTKVGPAGLGGVGRRFAGCLKMVAVETEVVVLRDGVAEVSTAKVIAGGHVEYRSAVEGSGGSG